MRHRQLRFLNDHPAESTENCPAAGARRWGVSLFIFAMLLTVPVPASRGEALADLMEKARMIPLQEPMEAHDLILSDITGNACHLRSFLGKVILLNIWATWCAPCREEMPSIEQLHRHFEGRDLIILAVSVDLADISVVKAFVDKHGYTFTVLHDPKGSVMKSFRVRLIPVSYVIDKSGDVVGKAVGLRDWSDANVIRLVEELLRESEGVK